MTSQHYCFLLELQQDRIMDKIIKRTLGIISIRQVFPSGSVYLIAYGKDGKKLHEEWIT